MNLLDRVINLEYTLNKTLREIDRDLFELTVYYSNSPQRYHDKLLNLVSYYERMYKRSKHVR